MLEWEILVHTYFATHNLQLNRMDPVRAFAVVISSLSFQTRCLPIVT